MVATVFLILYLCSEGDDKIKPNVNLLRLYCIWSHIDTKYLVVELEGPVVDVDFLKLEVVNEVLEHVRHPDDPAAPPSAPPAPTTAQE